MPSIKLNQAHSKPLPEVRELANDLAAKLKEAYDVSSSWDNDNQLRFKRTGLSGTLKITDTNVAINLDLNFLLSSFKSTIEQRVREQLAAKLA